MDLVVDVRGIEKDIDFLMVKHKIEKMLAEEAQRRREIVQSKCPHEELRVIQVGGKCTSCGKVFHFFGEDSSKRKDYVSVKGEMKYCIVKGGK